MNNNVISMMNNGTNNDKEYIYKMRNFIKKQNLSKTKV